MASSPLSHRTISSHYAGGVVGVGMALDGKQHLVPSCRPPKGALASKCTPVIDTTKYTGCGACEAACQIRSMPFPADHAGRSDEMRLLCHNAQGAPTRLAHLFSLDHNGPAKVCETCHLALNLAACTCQACHVQDAVDTIHLGRGLKLEGDCMVCHPEGEEPLND